MKTAYNIGDLIKSAHNEVYIGIVCKKLKSGYRNNYGQYYQIYWLTNNKIADYWSIDFCDCD